MGSTAMAGVNEWCALGSGALHLMDGGGEGTEEQQATEGTAAEGMGRQGEGVRPKRTNALRLPTGLGAGGVGAGGEEATRISCERGSGEGIWRGLAAKPRWCRVAMASGASKSSPHGEPSSP